VTSLLRVVNETRQSVIGGQIHLMDTMLGRMRGFLLRRRPEAGEGIFLTPCRGVHMYGMQFPLDVLFVDSQGTVLAVHADLQPGRRTPVYRAARYAIELPSGTIEASRTEVGDRLSWKPGTAVNTEFEDGRVVSGLEAREAR
jgi:uncharacterized protein